MIQVPGVDALPPHPDVAALLDTVRAQLTPWDRPHGDWRAAWLMAYATNGGYYERACVACGVSRWTVQRYRRDHPDFDALVTEAEGVVGHVLLDEARRRAVEGCTRTYYDKSGNVTRVEVEYSDSLMAMLLRAAFPETFRDRSEVKHEAGNKPLMFMTQADRRRALDEARQAEQDPV